MEIIDLKVKKVLIKRRNKMERINRHTGWIKRRRCRMVGEETRKAVLKTNSRKDSRN